AKEAQNAPAPFTTYSLFFNGEFVTNEILSEKKIEKFLDTNIKTEEEKIKALGMDAFFAVSRGSINKPRFIVMRYFGDKESTDILG
ncbi:YoaP domain-containing protein, partial [Clostridioides difficile]